MIELNHPFSRGPVGDAIKSSASTGPTYQKIALNDQVSWRTQEAIEKVEREPKV
jgi:hypothetical protein